MQVAFSLPYIQGEKLITLHQMLTGAVWIVPFFMLTLLLKKSPDEHPGLIMRKWSGIVISILKY